MNDLISEQQKKYPDQYLLAYLDVLGTKDRTLDFSTSHFVAETLYQIQDFFTKQQEAQKTNETNSIQFNIESFIFSDTLVLFTKVQTENINIPLFNFCHAILLTQAGLLNNGIFSRGAITHGDFFIDKEKNLFFGPAFGRAYQLEQRCAKYPRVILDPSILDKDSFSRETILKMIPQKRHGETSEWLNIWTSLIKVDIDNFAYINYFAKEVATIEITKDMIWNIYPRLNDTNLLLSIEELSIREKYSWVIDKLHQREINL